VVELRKHGLLLFDSPSPRNNELNGFPTKIPQRFMSKTENQYEKWFENVLYLSQNPNDSLPQLKK